MKYAVQEMVAHKWFTVRVFDTEAEAIEFRAWLGHRTSRIKVLKK